MSLCFSTNDDATRKRLGNNVSLLWCGCTPAGSVHALSWFCCYCCSTHTHPCQARWESNSCYCFVIQFAIPSLPTQNARRIIHATQCMRQNSGQLLNFVCFTFSGRCSIWKFWAEILIEWLWDYFRKCWFHNYAMKSCFWEKVGVCREF